MKKLLIGLTLLLSMTAFADTKSSFDEVVRDLEDVKQSLRVISHSRSYVYFDLDVPVAKEGYFRPVTYSTVLDPSSLCENVYIREITDEAYKICFENLIDIDGNTGSKCISVNRNNKPSSGLNGEIAESKEWYRFNGGTHQLKSLDYKFPGFAQYHNGQRQVQNGAKIITKLKVKDREIKRLEINRDYKSGEGFLFINYKVSLEKEKIVCENH